jgi:HAD superfamily hydrolase (TIGR01484 family)
MTKGAEGVRLLISDVDGTLVTPEKALTERSIDAVRRLHDAGIGFAITSGRPPRGMQMLVEPLSISTPIAAFNGGEIVNPDLSLLEERTIPDELVPAIVSRLDSSGLDVWLYSGAGWYLRDPDRPHVAREAFSVAKFVGVSDDYALVESATSVAQEEFGASVSASRSQPYYVDVTHPRANKGEVAKFLSEQLAIPPMEIATIGDMPNDVLMFAHSGLSIAMGQSDREVQRAARLVTTSNDEDGFATAVERYILGAQDAPVAASKAASESERPTAQPAERS